MLLPPRRRTLHLAAGILFAVPVLNACASASATPAQPLATLMIKPRVPASDAEALMRTVRRSLPQPAMARYARPMSGGAHVVYLTQPATREQVPALIQRLRASGDFEYVDLDAPVRIK